MAVTCPSITPWVNKVNSFSHSSKQLIFIDFLWILSTVLMFSFKSKTGHKIAAATSRCWIDLNNHLLCLASGSLANPTPNDIFFLSFYSVCGLLQSSHLFFFSAAFCIILYWIILWISSSFFNLSRWFLILVMFSKVFTIPAVSVSFSIFWVLLVRVPCSGRDRTDCSDNNVLIEAFSTSQGPM